MSFEEMIGTCLLQTQKTLSLAESCTGGGIANRLTNIPRASGYFKGGVVCYQVEVKTRILMVSEETIRNNHVVSEAVALEMAGGVKQVLQADYGFGITGVLGPGDDGRIVEGTVCMAITDGYKAVSQTCKFNQDRLGNKEAAVETALRMIWEFLNAK